MSKQEIMFEQLLFALGKSRIQVFKDINEKMYRPTCQPPVGYNHFEEEISRLKRVVFLLPAAELPMVQMSDDVLQGFLKNFGPQSNVL